MPGTSRPRLSLIVFAQQSSCGGGGRSMPSRFGLFLGAGINRFAWSLSYIRYMTIKPFAKLQQPYRLSISNCVVAFMTIFAAALRQIQHRDGLESDSSGSGCP